MNTYYIKSLKFINSNKQPLINTIYNNFLSLKHEPKLNHNIKEISRLLYSTDGHTYLLNNGSKVIGYIVGEVLLIQDGRMVFYISYLYIGSNYRGKGLGTFLLNAVIEKCKNIGILFIMLTCDSSNTKLYRYYKKAR